MIESLLPLIGASISGSVKGLQHGMNKGPLKGTWSTLGTVTLSGTGCFAYLHQTRGNTKNWLFYEPFSARPTFLWNNIPLYVGGWCAAFVVTSITRKSYAGIMNRYITKV